MFLILVFLPLVVVLTRFTMADSFADRVLSALGFSKNHTSTNMDIPHYLPNRQFHVAPSEHFIHSVHGTYPRLCRLPDGSLLAGYTTFSTLATDDTNHTVNEHILTIARSTDNGHSFSPWGEVARSAGDLDNLFLLPLPNSETVLAAFRNHDLSPEDGKMHTFFRITVCESTDAGQTWHFLSQAAEKEAPFGFWEPFLRLGSEPGEIQLYFSQEFAPDDQNTMLTRSFDGGRTWSTPVIVTGEGERLRDGMVGLAKTWDCFYIGNGEEEGEEGEKTRREALALVMETTRHGPFSIEAVLSYDGGHTFGHRQVVYEPRHGKHAGAPQIASFVDGSVAVVFMTDEDGDGRSHWPHGAQIKVVFSGPPINGRFHWTSPMVVGDSPSFWPGIMRVGDHEVLAVYELSSSIRGKILSVTSWM